MYLTTLKHAAMLLEKSVGRKELNFEDIYEKQIKV